MGNWLGRNRVVHPLLLDHDDDHDQLARLEQPSTSLWVKVRVGASQLKELTVKADSNSSRDNSDLGRLILQECLEGRLTARVVPAGRNIMYNYSKEIIKFNNLYRIV
ncbi:hypothetical protein EZV62_010092 [Acer yangbiense]|uniref:Uncharacterized protein n=1 Tax=Acer yangbiense TaxID=1000413 RepID=A0A5C7I2A4_9ROSI|nr:hypothetical protein EZV62_010092 [Acer yangbiense]